MKNWEKISKKSLKKLPSETSSRQILKFNTIFYPLFKLYFSDILHDWHYCLTSGLNKTCFKAPCIFFSMIPYSPFLSPPKNKKALFSIVYYNFDLSHTLNPFGYVLPEDPLFLHLNLTLSLIWYQAPPHKNLKVHKWNLWVKIGLGYVSWILKKATHIYANLRLDRTSGTSCPIYRKLLSGDHLRLFLN